MQYNLKQQQSKLVCGRSMIEMLCVLAIVGILSAAAFVGFKAAINKYEANAILNDAAFALTAIHTRSSETGINEYRIDTGSKWEVSAFRSDELDDFAVVADVPKDVCQYVLPYKSKGTFGKFYDANSGTEEEMQELMSCADAQTIVFAYSQNSDNNPTPPEPEPEPDCSGITPIESCAISADVKDANGCVIKKKFSCTEGSTYCLDGEQCIACPTKEDIPSRACSIAAFSTCHQVNRDLGEACTNGLCDGEGNCVPQATCTSSQLSCSAGADSWCCDKVRMASLTCGTTKGECCASGLGTGQVCCASPKTILMDQEQQPHCCAAGSQLGRTAPEAWDCCDVGGTQVLVNSTGTAAAFNYCCPAGSIAYDATNGKCISECPANASTTVVSGNQIGYSACYCNEGYTWDESSGTCKAPGRCGTTGTTCDATCETSCTVAGGSGYTCSGGTCTCTTSGYAFTAGVCANGYCAVRNSFVLYCPTSANFTVTSDNMASVKTDPANLTYTIGPCKGSTVTNTAGISSSVSDNDVNLLCQPYKDGHFDLD